ncbi:vitelline membrane outer layer protein 1 homolog [Xenopus laevis]|uniref:Vitelline membrane outer layer protein 1 homolog n=2 Tax=Xenopus laevis TaxID=8355 RepID=A0A1L8H3V1_XENLA|nr:vitelline membrane outer layer protein 1 homolog [Xenopus laevis]OCT90772.1 hypothetical protein XELAEV_18019389mg [Xenopus laevis]
MRCTFCGYGKDSWNSSPGTASHLEDKMIIFAISIALLIKADQTIGKTIYVSNGGQQGEWGKPERCLAGTVAKGLSLKVEQPQGIGDDTSLNGIRLHCVRCRFPHDENMITSDFGLWGTWGPTKWCPYGFLSTFSLRVEGFQGQLDETAANNIKFKCSDNSTLEGDGLSWGMYGALSESCLYGICGITTKVVKPQGFGDDTALNDVHFSCCAAGAYNT